MSEVSVKVKRIVDELLNRSVAGVFAYLSNDGSIYPTWKQGVAWPIMIGLATRLQYVCYESVAGDCEKTRASTKREVESHSPLAEDQDLTQVPADQLILELYRDQGSWGLALRRDRKVEGKEPWEGCLWKGTGTTCMGLAALLQRCISDQVATKLDERHGHDPLNPLERRVAEILSGFPTTEKVDPTWAAGSLGFLTYECSRLKESTGRVGDTIQAFLEVIPIPPEGGPH